MKNIFMGILLGGCLTFSSLAEASITTGLDGYWSLNGTTADLTGNGNSLTLFGGAKFATGGQFGQALSLDGIEGSYAQGASSTAFNFGSNDFAVQIWANFNVAGGEQTLIEKFTGGAGPGWTFTTPGVIQFYAAGAAGYNASVGLSAGTWHQFLVQRNGNSLSMYYDGNLALNSSISSAITSSSNPLLIGARNSGDGRNFTVNGLIDNVGIWNRALNGDEISALWNKGSGDNLFAIGTPETSTWAMMLLGLVGIGVVRARQKRAITVV